MRKEKSNLRTRSREGTNIQQTSDRARGKERGYGSLSAHTSALLIAQAEGLPTTASPPTPSCGCPSLVAGAWLPIRCYGPWEASEGEKNWIGIKEFMLKIKNGKKFPETHVSHSRPPSPSPSNKFPLLLGCGESLDSQQVQPSLQIQRSPSSQVQHLAVASEQPCGGLGGAAAEDLHPHPCAYGTWM